MAQGNTAKKQDRRLRHRQEVEQEFCRIYGSPRYRVEIVDKAHFRPPALSMPDGCIEIDFPLAEAMVRAASKDQQGGGFHVLEHENGHDWESKPFMSTTPSELKKMSRWTRFKLSWHMDAFSWRHINNHHAGDEKLELRKGGQSQWQADLYALVRSENPVEDFASALAILTLREIEESWWVRVIYTLMGLKETVENDVESMFYSYGPAPFRNETMKAIARRTAEKFLELRG
jgi:hypothetical protein